MEINIEIKPSFSILTPDVDLLNNENITELTEKINEQRVAGCQNFIVNLNKCADIDYGACYVFMDIHETIYNGDGSLVFCEMKDAVLQKIKKEQLHLTLNITPTFIEAVDIVNMETLERDLYNQ